MERQYRGIKFVLEEFVWIGQVGARRPADELFLSESDGAWTYWFGHSGASGRSGFDSFEAAIDAALLQMRPEKVEKVRAAGKISSLLQPIGLLTGICLGLILFQRMTLP